MASAAARPRADFGPAAPGSRASAADVALRSASSSGSGRGEAAPQLLHAFCAGGGRARRRSRRDGAAQHGSIGGSDGVGGRRAANCAAGRAERRESDAAETRRFRRAARVRAAPDAEKPVRGRRRAIAGGGAGIEGGAAGGRSGGAGGSGGGDASPRHGRRVARRLGIGRGGAPANAASGTSAATAYNVRWLKRRAVRRLWCRRPDVQPRSNRDSSPTRWRRYTGGSRGVVAVGASRLARRWHVNQRRGRKTAELGAPAAHRRAARRRPPPPPTRGGEDARRSACLPTTTRRSGGRKVAAKRNVLL